MASPIYCAPDLPFGQTVLWYLKQIGSQFIIVMGILLTLAVLYALFVWASDRKRKRRG